MTDNQSVVIKHCFEQTAQGLNELFREAYELSRKHFSNLIHCYAPGLLHYETSFYQASDANLFPAISITGDLCHLNCDHCNRQLLRSMIPATTPRELLKVCIDIQRRGGVGCLISGGSLRDGSVPLQSFVPTIEHVKRDLGLRIVLHTGLVKPSLAKALANADIDAAMIDVIGSNDTIREIYHLDHTILSFDRSLTLLHENGIQTVPHILVGIQNGMIRGEREAVRMVARHNPAAVVVVALTPLANTRMEHITPPRPLDIARVLLASRLLMPQTPILLGCARPRGEHKVKTEIMAIRAGVNGIAYPADEAIEFAERTGLRIRCHEKCCALIWQDMNRETGCVNESRNTYVNYGSKCS